MTIQVTKEPINLREKLNELETNKGLKGNEILQAETAQEVRSLIGAGRKNLIINGDMRVSQRGDYTTASSATNGGISLDRWEHHLGSVTANVQDTVKKQKIIATSTNASAYLIQQQIVEFHTDYASKTVTASAKITSNNANARLVIHDGVSHFSSTAHSGNGAEELLTVTATLGASPTTLKIRPIIASATSGSVSITSGDYIEFGDVQLELGSVATDFEHRSYGEELALCQRYYQKISSNGLVYTTYSTTQGYMQVPTPVQMRVLPSISWNIVDRVALASTSNITTNITYWSSYSNSPSSFFSFQARSSVALTSGLTYVMFPTAVTYMALNAEL